MEMVKGFSMVPGTKYLLLDVRPDGGNGVLVGVDDDKRIHIGKTWRSAKFLRHFQKLRPFRFLPTVIVSASRELVYTSIVPVRTDRENPLFPITPVELENILGKLLTGIFAGEREAAALSLGVHELDAVLVGARVADFLIDNADMVNPVGQKGRRITADFEITFVARSVFDAWKNFFNSWKEFYLTETTHAFLRGLAKSKEEAAHILIAKDGASYLYTKASAKNQSGERWSNMDFDPQAVLVALEKHFAINEAAAAHLYARFRDMTLSPSMTRSIEGIIRPVAAAFSRECRRLALKGRVFVYSPYPLPFELPKKIGSATFEEIPVRELFSSLGFSFSDIAAHQIKGIIPHLFSFLEFYYDNKDTSLNYWLKRRVHWLMPNTMSAK